MARAQLPPHAGAVFREFLTTVVLHGQQVADAMGLHPTDAYALNVLEVFGPVTVGEIGERIGLSTGAATRLVDRLEAVGAVARRRDTTDRRRVLIEVTPDAPDPTGRADPILGAARSALAAVFDRYDTEQLEVLFDFFEHAGAGLRTTLAHPAAAATAGEPTRAAASPQG